MPPNTTDSSRHQRRLSTAAETTPLLTAPEFVPDAAGADGLSKGNGHIKENGPVKPGNYDTTPPTCGEEDDDFDKPMPYVQILILCYASLAEPVAYFCIFPFINEMIYRVGEMPESSVGFWTGLVESLFSLVQMVLMIVYGRAADRYGRKPVLVFSSAGVSLATALFGMSRTLWQIILFRCFAGLFAGSVVTIRTMISENCTKRTQARAFSWYMFCRNLGIFIGPIIGGSLACPIDPAQAPGAFCNTRFFGMYPYSLASWVAGLLCLSATLPCQFGLKETLQPREDGSKAKGDMSTMEVLKSPGVPMVLFIYGYVMFLSLGFTATSPVFAFTSISKGGLGFSDRMIAIYLATCGASQAFWMLLPFTPLQRRLGTGNLLRLCIGCEGFFFAFFPAMNEIKRHGTTVLFNATFWPGLFVGSGVAMAFACVQLCLNDVSPSSRVLATVNALALMITSATRAFAPVAFTSLYAVGVKLQWADGHLAWVVLTILALVLNVPMFFLPVQAEGRYDKPVAAREEEDTAGQGGGAR